MCKCDVSLWGNLIDFALTKNVKKRAVHTFSIAQIGQNKRARTAQMVDVCARHRPQSRSRELFEATGNGPNAVQGERITGISSYNQTPDATFRPVQCVQHNLRAHITVQHSVQLS